MKIMDTPGWAAIIKLVAMTVSELNARVSAGSNAFEVLRSLHTREGKVAGLTEFFNGLENAELLTGDRS
jgi:hypothetical protein